MNSRPLLVAFSSLLLAGALQSAEPAAPHIGAWQSPGDPKRVMIVTENYWSQTAYRQATPEFLWTLGGTYTGGGGTYTVKTEFDSKNPEDVGARFEARLETKGDELKVIQEDGSEEVWTRIDRGNDGLAGTWRITGRHVNGSMVEMPLQARRTLKILSGTRFQWVAINVETGEFSGTGGGTYTYQNGKYVEKIEFFSRDNSRVGARLEFDAELKGNDWHHSGKSSKGDPIHEVWSRFSPQIE